MDLERLFGGPSWGGGYLYILNQNLTWPFSKKAFKPAKWLQELLSCEEKDIGATLSDQWDDRYHGHIALYNNNKLTHWVVLFRESIHKATGDGSVLKHASCTYRIQVGFPALTEGSA